MAQLSTQALNNLKQITTNATADATQDIPGATVVIVGKDGKELFASATGKRGVGSKEPLTLDSIFWIASCTKMLTGIACMQLVEKGKLSLDDAAQVEKLCPYLKEVQVLQDDGTLVAKKCGITLRMLLSHTVGFGYTFFNEKLRDWSKPVGIDEFSGSIRDVQQPLVHQPGEAWEYGLGIDWAGQLVEKVTGLSLNDYFQENIFKPLGLNNINMFPTESMKRNLVYMNFRGVDGKLVPEDHLLRKSLVAQTKEEIASTFNSGGAGCFAKPQEYCQILATLLNDGTSPTTAAKILEKATVDEMFRNQIPQFPNFGRRGIPAAKPHLTNALPDLYPVPDGRPQGWGLTFMLTGSDTARTEGTGNWAGLANLFWWCDRKKGVAGMVCSQVLPFEDLKVLTLLGNVEAAVYNGLK
ncbi:beta-lactamase family protein [Moniliophthora roreri]|uniref:Beta-lactamase-related domain-containing protein n=1 Tax=Moniliophthora roreri TaxID=221103 RepID=A0A0W0FKI2_MONRR|nr:beta-lactamase family protein [Moniliophthora roreri]